MTQQLTLTFAGDESGDVSFAFGKGATRYFVVAVIATFQPEALREALASIRQKSGLPASYEFKFHSLSSASLRKRTFQAITQADFEAWALMVDKTTLPDAFKLLSGLDFYLYFVTELIRIIPEDQRNGATLILDEFGSAERLPKEMRRVLKARGISPHFKRMLVRRSHSEPLIQVADLVAGAVLHRDARHGSFTYSLIETRLRNVIEYRP
jgi:hypothetical protein